MPSCYLCFAILMDFVCLHELTSAMTERKKTPIRFFFCGGKNFGIAEFFGWDLNLSNCWKMKISPQMGN